MCTNHRFNALPPFAGPTLLTILVCASLATLGAASAQAQPRTATLPPAGVLTSPPALPKSALARAVQQNRPTLWTSERRAAATRPDRLWPVRADPRRWPRLFANTTECTLSLNPVNRRHWWQ